MNDLFKNFPKKRNPLPENYAKIYDEHYENNRNGATTVSFFSSCMEKWMHNKVAKDVKNNSNLKTLEIGAGTLNQIAFEDTKTYDIVEPFELLYKNSPYYSRVRNIYTDVSEISGESLYDRITCIAAFEHICNLPDVVGKCYQLLNNDGCLRVAIPNEGRFLWKFAYTMTTGIEFKHKYNLDYSVLMNYEHVNTADEIEAILKYYFSDIKISLMGINKDFSFYRYYECKKR